MPETKIVNPQLEAVHEHLTDLETALVNVSRDYFPATHYQIKTLVSRELLGLSLQLLGKSDLVRFEAFKEIAINFDLVWKKQNPSIKLKWDVIAGEEACGLVVQVTDYSEVVYGHIIKLQFAYLQPSDALRALMPWLPERIML